MKKSVFISIISIIFIFTFNQELLAQIKVHQDGQISLQTLSNSYSNGVQIHPSGRVFFNTTDTEAWHWVTMANPKHQHGKCWIVSYPNRNNHNFFVTGEGYAYKVGSLIRSDISLMSDNTPIERSGEMLDRITGYYYIPIEDNTEKNSIQKEVRVGIPAQEVQKVIPEAVKEDSDGMLYLDYDVLTVFLIETVKEQRKEIEEMRKTLIEHGLLKPEK